MNLTGILHRPELEFTEWIGQKKIDLQFDIKTFWRRLIMLILE
jgi:hypothetical protein